ncbi:MAG: aldehyde dehydrogenase family protein, partial [Halopseudomonas sp.]
MNKEFISTHPTDLYIGGKWMPSSDESRFSVFNPATEEEIASVSSATQEDAIKAVDAAYTAGVEWRQRSPRERAEILRKAFELMTARKDQFATLISLEEGKTYAEGLGEVAYAAEFFRWYSEEAVRDLGVLARSPSGANNILVQH